MLVVNNYATANEMKWEQRHKGISMGIESHSYGSHWSLYSMFGYVRCLIYGQFSTFKALRRFISRYVTKNAQTRYLENYQILPF